MIAADIMTAPVSPTAPRRNRAPGWGVSRLMAVRIRHSDARLLHFLPAVTGKERKHVGKKRWGRGVLGRQHHRMSDDFWPKKNTETPHMPGSPKLLGRAFRPFAGAALLVIVASPPRRSRSRRRVGGAPPAGTTAVISGTPDLLGLLPSPVAGSLVRHAGREPRRQVPRLLLGVRRALLRRRRRRVERLRAGHDDRRDHAREPCERTAGEPSHSNCQEPAISDDGRRVAFVCDGPLTRPTRTAPRTSTSATWRPARPSS